ncbi:hypothetical protein B0H14DRAFT_2648038 [Mycena olivaceomarginata]|nr:hypothetical protein B0H14DRAFT_2648038 [Mycena olivaceomarginata]
MFRVMQSRNLRPPLPKLPYQSSLRTPCLRDSISDCHVHSCIVAYSVSPSSQTAWRATPRAGLLTFIGILTPFLRARDAVLPHAGEADWAACGKVEHVRDHGDRDSRWSFARSGVPWKYPVSAERVNEGLVDVFDEKGWNIFIHHAEDGSGVGSAIIIPTTTKIRKEAGLYANV